MLKKSFAFVAQPHAHFRVKMLEAHYDSFGDKTAEDTHLTNHILRKKLRALDASFVPLDIASKTDYEDGRQLSELGLKILNGKTEINLKAALKNSIVYQGRKHYQDFVEEVMIDGVKKKRRTKLTKPIYFEWDGHKFTLAQEQSLVDYLVICSLKEHPELLENLQEKGYNVFSDRRFSPKKSSHSLANSLALVVALIKEDLFEEYANNVTLLIEARAYH